MSANLRPYREARLAKGWWQAHRYGVLRRAVQLGFLGLFLSGPWFGVWITKGTLATSLTLGVLPLTDPFIALQSLAARHWPEMTAAIGAVIVLVTYLLVGGRSYCAWVCPINPVTDLAAHLRRRLAITQSAKIRPDLRLWFVAGVLLASAASGMVVWELVNPITNLHRALAFALPLSIMPAVAVLVFDLLVARHGWCGHLCPVGAFFGQIGRAGMIKVSAGNRAACDDCMDCFSVCPEPHVISPALRGEKLGLGPLIQSGDCTLCGACIDVCPERVFRMSHRFDVAVTTTSTPPFSALPERTVP